jgi:hypothetical protein
MEQKHCERQRRLHDPGVVTGSLQRPECGSRVLMG